ncbi:MAG: phosphotransferase [Reichenbachiella sp.]
MSEQIFINRLHEQGLINKDRVIVTPLTGGVSCQILLLDDGNRRFVLKSALEKLKVKDDWFADVKRNKTEQLYLSYVGEFLPNSVPEIIYQDEELNFFCMEMLENGMIDWKKQLLRGKYRQKDAVSVGELLAQIHKRSFEDEIAKKTFNTLGNFHQLRLEPYLLKTGERHPKLQSYFQIETQRLSATSTCLVHGDFSPKNIMVSPNRMVVLDCEVAWFGDPVFDMAFLLNHFLLKALFLSDHSVGLLKMATNIWDSYQNKADVIIDTSFEKRLCHLLPMLMLSRVDGKSPVEYLNPDQSDIIRKFVYRMIPTSPLKLEELLIQWTTFINYETPKDNDYKVY